MKHSRLHLRRLGIDTYKETVVYVRKDCRVCLAEGFEVPARVKVTLGGRSIIATLNVVESEILEQGQAGLSEYAWNLLAAREGDEINLSHAEPIYSFGFVRSKIYGHKFSKDGLYEIIKDITVGRYTDIHISSFLTSCSGGRMSRNEIIDLTSVMVDAGDRLTWSSDIVVDKHCVGGLPGNRTTPIIVPIVAEFGLIMPKTSSRAITSPAGTADTMEVFTNVELSVAAMKNVIEKERGCIVWGGSVSLSPADDILIRVEKVLDLDSEGQMVASILSKKLAAGSTHVLIDIPIGPTAKVRTQEMADRLKDYLESIGKTLGMIVKVVFTDGTQPVGRGIGPALEARDVEAVLKGDKNAPQDLRDRALFLAGNIIEFSPNVAAGEGLSLATEILDSGKAWKKFQRICEAQGSTKEIPKAPYIHPYTAEKSGTIVTIDNRRLATIAKLAGAPIDNIAGVDLQVSLATQVKKGDVLFSIHAESEGELLYALDYLHKEEHEILIIEEQV